LPVEPRTPLFALAKQWTGLRGAGLLSVPPVKPQFWWRRGGQGYGRARRLRYTAVLARPYLWAGARALTLRCPACASPKPPRRCTTADANLILALVVSPIV